MKFYKVCSQPCFFPFTCQYFHRSHQRLNRHPHVFLKYICVSAINYKTCLDSIICICLQQCHCEHDSTLTLSDMPLALGAFRENCWSPLALKSNFITFCDRNVKFLTVHFDSRTLSPSRYLIFGSQN